MRTRTFEEGELRCGLQLSSPRRRPLIVTEPRAIATGYWHSSIRIRHSVLRTRPVVLDPVVTARGSVKCRRFTHSATILRTFAEIVPDGLHE